MLSPVTLHLPPKDSSAYVRVVRAETTLGYLGATYYDRVFSFEGDFESAMQLPGAEEEAHSRVGRRVVRLRGDVAVRALYVDLRQ